MLIKSLTSLGNVGNTSSMTKNFGSSSGSLSGQTSNTSTGGLGETVSGLLDSVLGLVNGLLG
ncbi:hypothetical protein PPL_02631 [Heterostelium album PN500]|uniref:Uncharacterized protein n=1 Tax=Heterostelium pallidum (strain ATCC 26659 / Pp 5 / PN500) TaxID=670386 RepID=D3B2L7_HETP5|nr:hypothetical protein PPL_02631 [Heterostelium album PN500]EFA83565.1 hypothetical protein PPL_02631 [Heterostelium album PN500]|eukprot:XP_020435682.1 hypothetical protein PPL_02631 [Heterostelium album PN500]